MRTLVFHIASVIRAKKDLLAQLLALNQQVAAKIEAGEPVMPPGVPKHYPDAQKLVTEDCIRPAEAAWNLFANPGKYGNLQP